MSEQLSVVEAFQKFHSYYMKVHFEGNSVHTIIKIE